MGHVDLRGLLEVLVAELEVDAAALQEEGESCKLFGSSDVYCYFSVNCRMICVVVRCARLLMSTRLHVVVRTMTGSGRQLFTVKNFGS